METQIIQSKIHTLRGQRVMLDFDLADLYEVETRALKQAVRRNARRFPFDFMFELTEKEMNQLVSQNVIPAKKHFGGAAPFAFTEQGVAMLSATLRSDKAIDVNIAIMRAFVALRHFALTYSELSAKVGELEKELADVNEVLHWLGQENQSRADEIAGLQITSKDWETRRPIGF
ncbi:MAG: ORF6N domain-containing protein [Saprospiraceae bacterium]